MKTNNYTLILLKDGRNILVSDEEVKDGYYLNTANDVILKFDELTQSVFKTIGDIKHLKKIIAGIENLPTLIYSEEASQTLRDKYAFFTDDFIEELAIEYERNSGTAYNAEFDFYETGFKTHQSLTNKMFTEEQIK